MKRYAYLLVAGTLLLPCLMDAQSKGTKKNVGQLKKHLSTVRANKASVKKKLRETTHAVNVVRGDIHEVDGRLTAVENQLEDTNDRLDQGRTDQRKLAKELSVATKQLDDSRQQVRKRLRWMYVHGQSSFVSVLMGTTSVGDLASRTYVMERIAAKDRKVFTDYRTLKDDVADKKQRQDQLVVRIRGLMDTQKHQQSSLSSLREEKQQVLKGLRSKQGELQKMLAQFEADERQIQSQIEAFLRGGRSTGPAPKGKFFRPSNGPITSRFGMRYHPILHVNRMHAGVDFGAPYGSPIYAANDGVVIAAQQMRGYGNVVIVDHGGGISTVYGHCSRILVSNGQHVKRGQRIAKVGSTGLSTGPHLHFEVRVKGKAVNPLGYL